MPEPTKTPSTPNCIIKRRIGGGGHAAGGKVDHRHASQVAGFQHQLVRGADLFGKSHHLFFGHVLQAADLTQNRAGMAHSFHHIAGAGLALGADHRRAFADPAQRFAQVAAAANKRHFEVVLVDMVLLRLPG